VSSGLLERFADAGIPLDTCVLRYRYIDASQLRTVAAQMIVDGTGATEADIIERTVLLIEDLLTRLSPSAFVKRPG
jgi:UDP-N-acetylenolpyruvoylglucosamine reductase